MESFGKIKRRFGFGGESIHKEPRCRKRRFLAVLISIVIVLGNPEFPGMGTLTACAASDEFQFDLNPDWNVDSIHPDEENIIELDVATGGVYEFEIRYETTNGETNLWADVVGLDGERQIHAGKVDFYNPNWWPFVFWGTHTFDLKLPRGKSTIHFFEPEHLSDSSRCLVYQIKVKLKSPLVPVSDIYISSPGNKTVLYTGEQIKLSAEAMPSNATFRGVIWSVDNYGPGPWHGQASIASDGTLTAVKSGRVEVRAKSVDG